MRYIIFLMGMLIASPTFAQNNVEVASPDGNLNITVSVQQGKPVYAVSYKGRIMLENSPLGLTTNEGDFSTNLSLVNSETGEVDKQYTQRKIKQSYVEYTANTLTVTFENADEKQISVRFQVSNNDIAFRYELPVWGETLSAVVEKEATGFRFPSSTKAFLSSMMEPMTGFARTAPSYESGYVADEALENTTAEYGYVFPGLFRVGDDGWVLLTETGVSSQYNASHLSSHHDGVYRVEYPHPEQNNAFGSTGAQIGLPGVTPWRTITVGESLKPIVETTIPWDVVEPLYEPSQHYEFGRGTWSWIIWQDNSMNYKDQVTYIDLAAAMDFEFILIDAWWDANIGYKKMEELIRYARSKEVGVFLWYNSNGSVNDAFQTPKDKMHTSIARKKEMKWLQEVGVKGIKVDFLGGDKQTTMRLYEDILSDANDYGLQVIFHGTTLPRGWERMYPNFVGNEAVLASEMLVFVQDVREKEAFYAALHPFIRNSVASMEFGGVVLNKYLNKGNEEGQERLTTNAFQLATGVLFQNPVQMFALTPNNLDDASGHELNFMRELPTTWNETRFIDGYPGKYAVIARRSGQSWYVAGINAEDEPKKLNLDLSFISKENGKMILDGAQGLSSRQKDISLSDGTIEVEVDHRGGFVMKF
ncbi:glycoside hydrolase family 97 protein [Gracilimonas mengyeensis]|uniref:Glycosyl-hydrolase 97 C-terminal, oligomerisation n=1 Tax=Gracilimonas mengyeensis TaxID=1302730 RepID=A0A521AYK9_9BACT|nr:glycoside hydrolase family 97 protein [Gracilimonas mengyeensis]SMO39841.1 Glycosyl-hydrolase 97 C-terminal, oligomerisation [Gracilimonas mengyeensis]